MANEHGITPEPTPQNPQIQDEGWNTVGTYCNGWEWRLRKKNEGRMRRLNERTLLGPTCCAPWTGIRVTQLWAPVSLFTTHPRLQLYLVTIWRIGLIDMDGPSPADTTFFFFCVPLLRATQQLAREQHNQAAHLWVSIPGGFPSAWPCPVLLLATWFQIWRSGTGLPPVPCALPCYLCSVQDHLWV